MERKRMVTRKRPSENGQGNNCPASKRKKLDVRPWSDDAPTFLPVYSLFIEGREQPKIKEGAIAGSTPTRPPKRGSKKEIGMRLPVEGCCHLVLSPFSPTFVFVAGGRILRIGPGPPSSCNFNVAVKGGKARSWQNTTTRGNSKYQHSTPSPLKIRATNGVLSMPASYVNYLRSTTEHDRAT